MAAEESGATDGRLLPLGFAWAVAAAVVYTAGCIIAAGFYLDLAFMAGFIFAAMFAAAHTRLHESAPPAKGLKGLIVGFFWHGSFWFCLFACMFFASFFASGRDGVLEHWWSAAAAFTVSGGTTWMMTRLPFIKRKPPLLYPNYMEELCLTVIVMLGLITAANSYGLVVITIALTMVAGIFLHYVRYLRAKQRVLTIDKRLLPGAFAAGLALAVAAAVAHMFAFGFSGGLFFISGFIASASFAAAYTHAEEPAPPGDAAIRSAAMKPIRRHIFFWIGVAACLFMNLPAPPPINKWGVMFAGGIFCGWWGVRLPFFAKEKLKEKPRARLIEAALSFAIPVFLAGAAEFFPLY